MKKMGKKLLVWLVALSMLVSLLPATAFAEEETNEAVHEAVETIDEAQPEDAAVAEPAEEDALAETEAASEVGGFAETETAAEEDVLVQPEAEAEEEAEEIPVSEFQDMNLHAQGAEVEATPIHAGETQTLSSDGGEKYFVFMPEETALYSLEIAYDEDRNFYIELYDEYLNPVDKNGNFRLVCELEAGKTYYYGIVNEWDWWGSFTCEATLSAKEAITVTYHTEEPGTYLTGRDTVYATKVMANAEFYPYCNYWYDSDICNKLFMGWTTDKESATPETTVYAGTEDIHLYAIWAAPCVVTYHANSAVNPEAYFYYEYYNEETGEWEDEGRETKDYTVGQGSRIDRWANSPEQDGGNNWYFDGWSASEDASEAEDNIIAVGEHMDVYAVWKSSYVTVTFDANGGYLLDNEDNEISSLDQKVSVGDTFAVPSQVYYKDGMMNFLGWYTEKEGGSRVYSWEYSIYEDMTIYAHWQERTINPLEVGERFTVSSGNGEAFYSFTAEEEGIYRVIDENYGETDYWFYIYDKDFNTIAQGSGGYIDVELEPGEYYLGIRNEGDDPTGSVYGSFRFFIPETVLITYHTDVEGTYFDVDGVHTQTITKRNAVNTSLDTTIRPVSEGNLQFVGWSDDPEAAEANNYGAGETDQDVYAVWKQVYTVTYHSNGEGTWLYTDEEYDEEADEWIEIKVTENNQQLTEGSSISDYADYRPANPNPDIMFAGWATTADAELPDNDLTVTGNMDVYAVWTKKCTVTYDVNISTDIAYFEYWNEEDDFERVSTRTITFAKGAKIDSWSFWPEQDNWDYEFRGWSANKNATAADPSIVVTGDMTLYGVWVSNYAKVTFDANGGYFYEDDPSVTTITRSMERDYEMSDVSVYSSNKFSKFLGWFDAKVGGRQYIPWETIITEDVTLYAHWHDMTPKTLVLDQGTAVSSTTGEVLYAFTPSEDGAYRIYSYNHGEYSPRVICYNPDMEEEDENAYGRGGINFAYNGVLKAGKTYYFGISTTNNDTSFAFNIVIRKYDSYRITYHLGKEVSDAYYEDGENKVTTLTIEYAKGTNLYGGIQPTIVNDAIDLAGWSTTEGATAPDTYSFVVEKDLDLYAVWRTYHTITAEANNPNAWYQYWIFDPEFVRLEESQTKTFTVPEGEYIADYIDAPTDMTTTKTFIGWSTDPAATEPENALIADKDMTVYAIWTETIPVTFHTNYAQNPKAYYVHWDLSGNEVRVEYSVLNTIKGASFSRWSMNDFENEDTMMEFVGWATKPGATEAEEITVTEAMDVYAVWKPRVTVTLHTDMPGTYFVNGWDDDDEEIHSATAETVFTKDEYISEYDTKHPVSGDKKYSFAGWATTQGATEAEDEIYAVEGLNLYAVWKQNVDVTLVANHAGATIYDYDQGNKVPELTTTYSEDEYIGGYAFDLECTDDSVMFAGWSRDKNATEPEYGIHAEAGLKLYAVWKQVCKVTFHANHEKAWYPDYDGEFEEQESTVQNVLPGTWVYRWTQQPAYDSSLYFAGWSKNKNATEPDGDYYEIYITEDTELYAVWKKTVTVTYDPVMAQGGYYENSNPGPKKVAYPQGASLNSIAVPNLMNKDPLKWFNGWEDAEGNSVNDAYIVNEDITLYARWEKITDIANEIKEDQTVVLSTDSDRNAWFTFVPTADGTYLFKALERTKDVDPYGTIYQIANGELIDIASDDDTAEDLNFGVICDLNEGETYYLRAGTYSEGVASGYSVTIAKTALATVLYNVNHDDAWFSDSEGNPVSSYSSQQYVGLSVRNITPSWNSSTIYFRGWSTDKNATYAGYRVPIDGNMTVYGIWGETGQQTPSDGQQTPSDGQQTPSEGDEKTDLSGAMVVAADKTYTGKALKPAPTVTLNGEKLVKDTDYTVSYSNNTNAGTATITVEGKGDYSGTATGTFTINKAEQTITLSETTATLAYGGNSTIKVTGAKGALSYKSASTAIAKAASVSTGVKVTAVKYGKTTVTVSAKATTNYKAATAKITVQVKPAATSSLTATNKYNGVSLTWKKVTGAKGYLVYRKTGSGAYKKLTTTGASTVTYLDKGAKTNGTKYTFKIVPTSVYGNGTAKTVVKYFVSRPAISKVTSEKAKNATVKWGKNAKATGYEVQFSLKSNFSTIAKKKTITKAATVTWTQTGLASGKTYYVRVRAYKTVSGKKYYSAWSAKKTVKTK